MTILSFFGLMKRAEHEGLMIGRDTNITNLRAEINQLTVDRDQWRTDCLEAISDGEVIERKFNAKIEELNSDISVLTALHTSQAANIRAYQKDLTTFEAKTAETAAIETMAAKIVDLEAEIASLRPDALLWRAARDKRAARKGVGK